ncbi:putative disease resistance protein At3g14460 isoform X2 [Eucalyptus grandis]|uniref:putative disease resistance protein At3g14460 isoform X2 n=1 Tax=Eucalyptus grandis TaxID=71139 RepID=UPI00192F0CFA|nr:putative disease resistance protein At3g14460 isoform X2 [Eucalyptus grandis]
MARKPSYFNIVHLRLHRCCSVKALPSLGQLSSLKELYIEGLNAICIVGFEFYGTKSPFPSLITLEFKDMLLWEDWSHCIGIEEVGVLFPCLTHLIIWDCPLLIGRLPGQLSSLMKLEINSCPRMNALPFSDSLPSLNELNIGGCNERVLSSLVNLTSLTTLVIKDVAELTCLNRGFTSFLIKLEKLEIKSCEKLIYLWQDRDVIRNLTSLKSLLIERCPEFISFVAGEGDVELPSNVETIDLRSCFNLEKLPSQMHALTSLRGLTVFNCPKLVSFPETGIPASIISLKLSDCEMLQSLPIGLSINLDEPSSSSSYNHRDMTSCLQGLRIYLCDSLPASPFSEGCESITCFPHGGLPPQLQELELRGCRNMKQSVSEWLTPLTSLQYLSIDGSAGGVGEVEDLLLPLPSSLIHLRICDMRNVERLSSSLPRSLRTLEIQRCPKLRDLPQDGLPASLEQLLIDRCEILKERCSKLTGAYWLLIQKIPEVRLTGFKSESVS